MLPPTDNRAPHSGFLSRTLWHPTICGHDGLQWNTNKQMKSQTHVLFMFLRNSNLISEVHFKTLTPETPYISVTSTSPNSFTSSITQGFLTAYPPLKTLMYVLLLQKQQHMRTRTFIQSCNFNAGMMLTLWDHVTAYPALPRHRMQC